MKKIKYVIFLMLTMGFLASCVDYEDATEPLKATSIRLVAPETFVDNSALANRTITLQDGSHSTTVTTNGSGVATIETLTPGIYNISASWAISSTEYASYTGGQQHALSSTHKLTMAGSLTEQHITADQTIDMPMSVSEDQDIVISKIYFATSKDNNNKNYEAGRYIELFNQSDDSVDVAGLYIGLTEADSPQAYTLENLMDANGGHPDSLLLKMVFRIPADTVVKIAPGGTLLIVNSAIDHTKNNTKFEHDLTGADFEAKDRSERPVTNNPNVPALELVYSWLKNVSNLNMHANGLCGVVIFRTDEDVKNWPVTYKYPNTATSGNQWKLLSKRLVLDGVECLPNKQTTGPNMSLKRLYADIDASSAHIEATGGRTGEVVYRKTSDRKSDGGHLMLVDTNNSANDFQVSTTIKPREYDGN